MANNNASNITRKVAEVYLPAFEAAMVLSKNVDTQMLQGKYNSKSGDTIDFHRPTDYKSSSTAGGDLTAETASPIIHGKASGVVQNFRTVFVDIPVLEEAISAGDLGKVLRPMARRLAVDIELNFADFMRKNAGLMAGTYGTAVTTWSDVARAGAVMKAAGIPEDADWNCAVNPYTQVTLADQVRSLGAGGVAGSEVSAAMRKATIAEDYAGLRVMAASTLSSMTSHSGADRVGALSANPDVTYVTAKDTMTQVLAVSGFTANLEVRAGEVVQIAGRYRLNLSTRQPVVDDTGAKVLYTAVVTTAVTLSGTGTGNLTVSGPAIFEAGGAYNTVEAAPISGDVVTLLGAASTLYQPNMFWHKEAFSLGFVTIPKLKATDTSIDTEDGIHLRVTEWSDGTTNVNKVRIDALPAYAVLNPFFAGQLWG